MGVIQGRDMVYVLKRTLDLMDPRLTEHGERVAFMVHDIMHMEGYPQDTIIQVCLMALVHDIGAYKTEEIDRLIQFETQRVSNHSIYGYLFLNTWLQHTEMAEMILHHHTSYEFLAKLPPKEIYHFANMLQLADRIDIYMRHHKGKFEREEVLSGTSGIDPRLIELFRKTDDTYHTLHHLIDGSYRLIFRELLKQLQLADDEIERYLQLIAYTIDFRSEQTVTHTILVVELAVQLAMRMGLSEEMVEKVKFGALLHDLGKISSPVHILEKPGALTKEETLVMKEHVVMTRVILEGFIDDEVCRIACRHHERLNGKGYPEGLTEKDLTLPEMILAVSDISSALISKRSYKDAYPKQDVIRILRQMAVNGDIHAGAVSILTDNYDEIVGAALANSHELVEKYHNLCKDYASIREWYDEIAMA